MIEACAAKNKHVKQNQTLNKDMQVQFLGYCCGSITASQATEHDPVKQYL